ncbi:ribosome silencing factor [Galactobacillus timonensis]|uniref:ribosome silencing factor n=1 Tax=Galactobacillus timonensis TaxID=2041840 RepID=UPI002409E7D6|nr:ribosome silencing factor [Galactobacillus timonensis]MDD6369211.1 ribosome silencing factor [Galactobacillus timonensis]
MQELLNLVEKTLDEKLAENITVIDMKGVSPFTDHFVICTAMNSRHANALAEDLMKEAEKNGFHVRQREGAEGSSWILVDLYDCIVHIFTEQARQQYRLEQLWGDRPMEVYEGKKKDEVQP